MTPDRARGIHEIFVFFSPDRLCYPDDQFARSDPSPDNTRIGVLFENYRLIPEISSDRFDRPAHFDFDSA